MFCEKFLSQIDCFIIPKGEVGRLGGFDVETFPLLVLISLESMEVESGLTLVTNISKNL